MGHLPHIASLEETSDRTMILNMGPQHPSTHGVLRLVLEIDGENVVRMMPDIGYLHTGIEKTYEAKFYQQCVPLADRMDYLAPFSNELGFVLAAEKLLGIEAPPRAQWIRVLMNELTRLNSHLVWLGTHAMDIAQSPAPEAAAASTPKIGIEDFTKVEMRVGQVLTAEPVAGAQKLLKLTVDIGSEVRQVVAGIAEHYKPEQLVGMKVVIVVNLQPRKLRGVESNGMIVAASVGPEGKPVLVTFKEEVEVGARLK